MRTADLQRFRTAMDSTGDAIFLVDRDTMRVVEVNTTASELLGYSREEFLVVGAADLGVGTAAQRETMYDSIIAGHETTHRAETIVRKDGSELPVEVHRHAQPSGAGWIIVEVMRDITERVEADQRLHHLAHYDVLTGLPESHAVLRDPAEDLGPGVDRRLVRGRPVHRPRSLQERERHPGARDR